MGLKTLLGKGVHVLSQMVKVVYGIKKKKMLKPSTLEKGVPDSKILSINLS